MLALNCCSTASIENRGGRGGEEREEEGSVLAKKVVTSALWGLGQGSAELIHCFMGTSTFRNKRERGKFSMCSSSVLLDNLHKGQVSRGV